MLDQSNNLNYYFLVALLFQIYICSKILKSLLYIFLKFDIIIVVSIAVTGWNRWISIWIINCSRYIFLTMTNHVFFISQLTNGKGEISKNYSNILMEQQLLGLMNYYHLMLFLLFLHCLQKIYLLFFLLLFILLLSALFSYASLFPSSL